MQSDHLLAHSSEEYNKTCNNIFMIPNKITDIPLPSKKEKRKKKEEKKFQQGGWDLWVEEYYFLKVFEINI